MAFPLTIAIPTFNRADALERLLKCLCEQRGISGVQVVVSDNGSTDRTAAVLLAFSHRLALKRSGFATNRGFDANYVNCIIAADGDHVWVLGDDDHLTTDAVESVLAALRREPTDILVCNGGDFRRGALVPRIAYPVAAFSNFSELMSQVGWHLCWIGTCIVRRSRYEPARLLARDFNAFVHLPLLFGALRAPFRGIYLDRILLHTTVNHSDYFKDPRILIETFGRRLYDTLVGLGDGPGWRRIAARVVRSFHDRLSMFGLREFLQFRSDERFGFIDFLKRASLIRRLNPWGPLFVFLYFVPSTVLKWVLAVFRHWRAARRAMGAET